jgi:hypothetical protein
MKCVLQRVAALVTWVPFCVAAAQIAPEWVGMEMATASERSWAQALRNSDLGCDIPEYRDSPLCAADQVVLARLRVEARANLLVRIVSAGNCGEYVFFFVDATRSTDEVDSLPVRQLSTCGDDAFLEARGSEDPAVVIMTSGRDLDTGQFFSRRPVRWRVMNGNWRQVDESGESR